MSRTLRWVFVALPCTPGLILLLAGLAAMAANWPDGANAGRAGQLFIAGGAVLLAGLGIGAFVAWRIAHPRPEPDDGGDSSSG